jgi:hypothetical protein
MLVYHRTDHAAAIMDGGFRDGSEEVPGVGELRGVFVSADSPLSEYDGFDRGNTLIELEIPEALFERYEWVEEGLQYREAMIPAAELNRHPRRVISDDEWGDDEVLEPPA